MIINRKRCESADNIQKEGYIMFKKALIVGIDDYGANSLNGCCNDANCISEMLEKKL